MKPIDALLIIRLLMIGDESLEQRIAHSTLAAEVGAAESTIKESLYRLEANGWVVMQSGKRSGCASKYTVMIDALPVASDLKATIISEEAANIARRYFAAIHKIRPQARIHRGWQQRFGLAIQRWLDQGCEKDRLVALLSFALSSHEFRQKALKGPQKLRRVWPQIVSSYDVKHRHTAHTVQEGVA